MNAKRKTKEGQELQKEALKKKAKKEIAIKHTLKADDSGSDVEEDAPAVELEKLMDDMKLGGQEDEWEDESDEEEEKN